MIRTLAERKFRNSWLLPALIALAVTSSAAAPNIGGVSGGPRGDSPALTQHSVSASTLFSIPRRRLHSIPLPQRRSTLRPRRSSPMEHRARRSVRRRRLRPRTPQHTRQRNRQPPIKSLLRTLAHRRRLNRLRGSRRARAINLVAPLKNCLTAQPG